jgi:glycosyltransferase involved in cell wall biosynthesis
LNPLVSIIIPNYDHAPYLEQRIESVLNQTYQNFEVILLDDCSTDNSWEILSGFKNHPRVSHCLRNESNSGSPFKQWQKGIELANGEWIWIAESDDWAEITLLEELLTASKSHMTVPLILCQSKTHFTDKTEITNHFGSSGKYNFNDFLKKFKRYNLFPNASAVIFKANEVKPAIFKELVKFKFCGDWLFWVHLVLNKEFLFIDLPLNHFRKHSNSVTSKYENTPLFRMEILWVNRYIVFRERNLSLLKRIKRYLFIQKELLGI